MTVPAPSTPYDYDDYNANGDYDYDPQDPQEAQYRGHHDPVGSLWYLHLHRTDLDN
jgi:hypothetical protein